MLHLFFGIYRCVWLDVRQTTSYQNVPFIQLVPMVDQKCREHGSIITAALRHGFSTFVLLTLGGVREFPVVETVLTITAIPTHGDLLYDTESSNPGLCDILEW